MKKIFYLAVFIIVIIVGHASADVLTSFYLQQGHNNNLFGDSYGIGDYYSSIGGEVKLYPNSFTEFSFRGDYNLYYSITDLSNLNGQADFTLIPTGDSSNLSLILSGSASKKSYGTLYNLYNNNNISGDMYLIYQASKRVSFKTSGYYSYIGYDNADEVTDKYFGFSGGANLNFLKNNTLDFEAFVYQKRFNSDTIEGTNGSETKYDFTDYKIRYSRPFGDRWGGSLNYTYHNLGSYSDYSISGYTIDYLSPWASLWNGPALSMTLKHYLKNQSILELFASYTDKEYVRSFDYTDIDNTIIESFQRSDQMSFVELKYYKNFVFDNYMISPVLTLSLTENSSSLALYDYNTFNISLASTFSF